MAIILLNNVAKWLHNQILWLDCFFFRIEIINAFIIEED